MNTHIAIRNLRYQVYQVSYIYVVILYSFKGYYGIKFEYNILRVVWQSSINFCTTSILRATTKRGGRGYRSKQPKTVKKFENLLSMFPYRYNITFMSSINSSHTFLVIKPAVLKFFIKLFWKTFQNSLGNTCNGVLFLEKLQNWGMACNFSRNQIP